MQIYKSENVPHMRFTLSLDLCKWLAVCRYKLTWCPNMWSYVIPSCHFHAPLWLCHVLYSDSKWDTTKL